MHRKDDYITSAVEVMVMGAVVRDLCHSGAGQRLSLFTDGANANGGGFY